MRIIMLTLIQLLVMIRYAEVFAKPVCDGGLCPTTQVPDHNIRYELVSMQWNYQ